MTFLVPLDRRQTTTTSLEIPPGAAFSAALAVAKDQAAAGNILSPTGASGGLFSSSSPGATQPIPSNYYFDLVPPEPAFGPGPTLPGRTWPEPTLPGQTWRGPTLPGQTWPGQTFILPFPAHANGPDEPQDTPEPSSADNYAAQAEFYADKAATSAAHTIVLADATAELYEAARVNAWPGEESKVARILTDVGITQTDEEDALVNAGKAFNAALNALAAAAANNPEAAAASAAVAKAAAESAAGAEFEAGLAYKDAKGIIATMTYRNTSLGDLPKWPE
jgi:hypothetical protein